MKQILAIIAIVTLSIMSLNPPLMAADKGVRPIVVELFTSQSCYSCPPAEAYLGELAKDKNLVALEYHVDYWDSLIHGGDGKWKDVHSSPKHTARQRIYADRLPDGQSYTPQMVIDGQAFAVGSNKRAVRSAITKAKSGLHRTLAVSVTQNPAGGLTVKVDGTDQTTSAIWLVQFLKSVATRVRAGENRGKTLINHNIVSAVTPIGAWRGKPLSLTIDSPTTEAGQGCAVMVQTKRQGPIMGVAICPSGSVAN
jgi:hypothetical protein